MPVFGLPGGKGPNRKTKFVARRRPFADGYAFVGMAALAVTQLVLVTAEVDAVRTDHNRALMFGRAAATPAGQPFATWPKPQQRVEAEEDAQRGPNNTTLHLYRTGYQTVGQPSFLLSWKTSTLEAETYEVKTAPPDLHRYRTGYQTVGQPWGTWPKPAVADQSIEPDAQRTDQTLLHKYRVGYQTVGQPPSMWPGPQKRVASEEYIVLNVGAAYSQAGTAPAVSAGQPRFLWPTAKADQTVEDDAQRGNHAALHLYRQAYQTVGQPFALWPAPAKTDQTVEPDPVRTDHTSRLFFGRAPLVAAPGQPWHLWKPQVRHTPDEQYIVLNVGTFASQAVAVASPGQPWRMWPAAKASQDVEDDARRTDHASRLLFGRTTPAVAAPGAPWFLWKPQVRHTEPEEYTVPKPSNFALTRVTIGQQWYIYAPAVAWQDVEDDATRTDHAKRLLFGRTTPTGPAGQPRWLWPSAKADQTVEPSPVITDHAAALYPFRPHGVVTPPTDVATAAEAGGYWPTWPGDRKRKAGKRKTLEETVVELIDEVGVQAVAEAVKPATKGRISMAQLVGGVTVKPADLTAIVKEIKRRQQQLRDDDDDEEELLLLM